MRNLTVLAMVAMAFIAGHAQNCCPYINSVNVLPALPTDTHTVRIAIDISTPTMGSRVYLNHTVSGNQINIQGCYSGGMLPTITHHIDTLVIGTLPVGNYQVNLTARMSSDPNSCVAVDSNQTQVNFTVASSAGPACCITADSVAVGPTAPIFDTNQVWLDAWVTTPGQGQLISHNVNLAADSLFVEACYYSDSAANPQSHTDSIPLGTLPGGTYHLKFIAQQSTHATTCQVYTDDIRHITFTVDSTQSNVGIDEESLLQWHVMPNPTRSQFSVEGLRKARPIKVYDTSGRLVFEDREYQGGKIDCTHWRPGIYLILIENQTLKVLVAD